MTVSSLVNKVVIAGNGVTTVFSYNFQINLATDVVVIYTDVTGVSTTLTSAQYSITGLTNPTGGTVTYNPIAGPIASGTTLTITRQLALTQPTSISNQGAFYPSAVEAAIDRAVMEVQQVNEAVGRVISAPITDATAIGPLPGIAQRASKAFLFDAAGNPSAGVMPVTGVISSAMQPVTAAASLGAGRIAFGLGAMSVEGIGKGLQDDGAGNARVNFITENKIANYSILATDHSERYIVTGPITFTLPATSTLWNGFEFMVDVYGGSLILAPNAADAIEGNATGSNSYVPNGSKAYICSDGAGRWFVRRVRSFYSPTTPGGYLTPMSGFPVAYGDFISVTTIYYTPDVHDLVPIYTGAEWIDFPFPELSCALNAAQQLANNAYDVFMTLVSGTPTLVIGPAWRQLGYNLGTGGFTSLTNAAPIVCTASGHGLSNGDIVFFTGVLGNTAANGSWVVSGVAGAAFTLTGSTGNGAYTAGSGTFASRGNGAGATQLTRAAGINVNAVQMTAYNGVTPYTIPAYQATYLGTILTDGVAGQLTFHKNTGQSRKWSIWNAYNRKDIVLRVSDPTASWVYGTATWRASNNTAANFARMLIGLPEETICCEFSQGASSGAIIAVGYTTTASGPGTWGVLSGGVLTTQVAVLQAPPTIGTVTVACVENGVVSGTQHGTESYMLMSVKYRG